MKAIFRKRVSCGSKFNQIYVPRNLDGVIEVGDEVEVRLVKKRINLYYSKGLNKLSEFKEGLIGGIFSVLEKYKEIKICFIVGSFLTKIIGYNDIDLAIITADKYKNLESKIYNELINKFNQNFHLMLIQESKFNDLLKICPLTISMFSNYISNKDTSLVIKRKLDKNHIKFLLMMPEDLLEVKVSSKIFLNGIRRLVTIERFLNKKLLDILSINNNVKNLINKNLYNRMNLNEFISENEIKFIRNIIKIKIKNIKKWVKNPISKN